MIINFKRVITINMSVQSLVTTINTLTILNGDAQRSLNDMQQELSNMRSERALLLQILRRIDVNVFNQVFEEMKMTPPNETPSQE